MANPEEISTVSSWKKVEGEAVALPSGNTCLLIRPGMEKLFGAGVLPDELTKIALESIDAAKAPGRPQDHLPKGGNISEGLDDKAMKKFMESENALQDLFASFDRVTEMCVVQPPVKWHMRKVVSQQGHWVTDDKGKPQYEEIPFNERDREVLYTDQVDSEDKMFIFNYVVGGTRDVESFRSEFSDDVATLEPRQDVELPPI